VNRRRFLHAGLRAAPGLALLASPYRVLAAARASRQTPLVERLYVCMGTTVVFQVYHEAPAAARDAIRKASSVIQHVHDLMSVQEPSSELARWNRSARGLDAPLHPLTAGALGEALRLTAQTGGRFDPSVGAAVQAYEQGRAPLRQAERLGLWDADNRRLAKAHPDVRLDLGASAKGWAVDRAVEILVRAGASAALVNAGGDLRVAGAPPGADAWTIGLRHPHRPDRLVGTLALRDEAIATSGSYERHGSTIVDPRDLSRIARQGVSASVVAPTCGLADGLSTALFVSPSLGLLPPEARGVIVRPNGPETALDTSPGLAVGPS
jgi:FAD:protein FMN transferase